MFVLTLKLGPDLPAVGGEAAGSRGARKSIRGRSSRLGAFPQENSRHRGSRVGGGLEGSVTNSPSLTSSSR